jgi:hypothetical protein
MEGTTIDSSSDSTAESASAAMPPRKKPRGYIDEFGAGRRCSARECDVVLSRYNRGALCWAHETAAFAAAHTRPGNNADRT